MTPEEFERIKQAEKEHLRKLKELKEAHRHLERQKKVTDAVSDMTRSMQEKLDVHADMMDKIGTESALNEARLEIALEADERAAREEQALKDEQDLAKEKAKELIRQMKAGGEIGPEDLSQDSKTIAPSSPKKSTRERPAADEEKDPEPKSKKDLPDKTIGRMKP